MSTQDRGWGGGRPNQNCLQNPKNERFFLLNWGKNQPKKWLIFEEDFKTKGVGGGRRFGHCLQKTKYERFFFATIPRR